MSWLDTRYESAQVYEGNTEDQRCPCLRSDKTIFQRL